MLTYPGVAEAIGEMAVLSEPILYDLALRVAAADHDGEKAGAFLVLARAEELRGNVLGAEAMVKEALGCDPDFVPAVFEGAIFASERGEAGKALELFGRAHVTNAFAGNPLTCKKKVFYRSDRPRLSIFPAQRPFRPPVLKCWRLLRP
jgi:hypothetical protein